MPNPERPIDWGESSETIQISTMGEDAVGLPHSARDAAKLKKEQDRERAANRLRKAGWSYRRIAETLSVPYIMIGRWLSGVREDEPEMRSVPEALRKVARPIPQVELPPAAAGEGGDLTHRMIVLSRQFSAFEDYVKQIAAEIGTLREELAALKNEVETLRAESEVSGKKRR